EHWMVVQGTARVTLEGQEITVETGGTMNVPLGAAHRIANPGSETLILIEIQRGSYLGEDDIIRLQDDYGRASASVQTCPLVSASITGQAAALCTGGATFHWPTTCRALS